VTRAIREKKVKMASKGTQEVKEKRAKKGTKVKMVLRENRERREKREISVHKRLVFNFMMLFRHLGLILVLQQIV